MLEYRQLTNALYKLDVTKWVWTKLNPVPDENGYFPVPRFGHSFNAINDKIFLFGGVTYSNRGKDCPQYLNDMFTLDLNGLSWSIPSPIIGQCPCPRESHSAVVFKYHTQGEERDVLIIYGGMNGRRLGDLLFFDVAKLEWSCSSIEGRIPRPRSLHSACVIGSKMYVFGGWTVNNDDQAESSHIIQASSSWSCCREFLAFNFLSFSWEFLTDDNESESYKYPPERAGHSVVAFDSRLYIFSGRFYDGKVKPGIQTYHKDFWCLDIIKPKEFPVLHLIKDSTKFLEIKWNRILCADIYILQVSFLFLLED